MPKQHLSDQFIKNLKQNKSSKKRIEYYDQHLIDSESNTIKRKGVKGLLVRLTKAGNKYFYYSYWFESKSKRYKIGSYPNMGLSEARDKARDIAGKVNKGIDPQDEKNKRKFQPEIISFKELATDFQERHLPTLRESTRQEYQRIIKNELLPKLEDMAVTDVTSHRLRKLLDDKAIKDGSPTMANRIRAVLSSMFDFAIKVAGLKIQGNPVEKTSTYKAGENKRDRIYDEDEIRELWEYFGKYDQPIPSVFKMLLITGQRKTETSRMRWDDIEKVKKDGFEGMVWTIPAKNAKNKREHEVPLSEMALQIIEEMQPITGKSDYVFESPIKENEPIKWLKTAVKDIQDESNVSDFRLHDLRRTAATYMAENGINPMVIGKVLNHKGLAKENTITARYNRASYLEQKQEALNRWGYKLDGILTEEQTEAKVTKIG